MIPDSEPTLPAEHGPHAPRPTVSRASRSCPRAYPGAIGELLAYELSSWGVRAPVRSHELVARLVDHIDELSAARGHDRSPSPWPAPRTGPARTGRTPPAPPWREPAGRAPTGSSLGFGS